MFIAHMTNITTDVLLYKFTGKIYILTMIYGSLNI